MEQVNRKQRRRVWSIAVILLGVLLVSVILVRSYNNRISKQMFNERSRILNTTTSKCAECLDILMENSQQNLSSAEELLSTDSADHPEKYEKASMLLDVAQWLQSQLKIDVETEMPRTVILLDSNLKTYSGDGQKSRWEEIDFLKEDEAICVTRLSYQEEDDNSLFVIRKLAQPIQVGKANLTHVVINIPVSTFDYLFRVEEYQNQNFTYLVGSDGERITRSRP